MNRLIIIGNGFDLAHGLPTRYEDFMLWYFKGMIDYALKNQQNIDDQLFGVRFSRRVDKVEEGWLDQINTLDLLQNHAWIELRIEPPKLNLIGPGSGSGAPRDMKPITIAIYSPFLRLLLREQKWADIEKAYFESLLAIDLNKPKYQQEVDRLNKDFEYIRDQLMSYIQQVDTSYDFNDRKSFPMKWHLYDCFYPIKKDIYESHFGKPHDIIHTEKEMELRKVLFVNFNYTSLLSRQLESLGPELEEKLPNLIYNVVHIHRKAHDPRGIVFGYGDDSHAEYKRLEEKEDESLLRNIKSFYYPADENYQLIDGFIENGSFEVFVIGHSLGLSDRVLLKTIFEHKYCKAIRLFHRGSEESQFRKRIALSRHFDDKIAMRKKIEKFSSEDVLQ